MIFLLLFNNAGRLRVEAGFLGYLTKHSILFVHVEFTEGISRTFYEAPETSRTKDKKCKIKQEKLSERASCKTLNLIHKKEFKLAM